MKILRFIMVLFTCLSFATAVMAEMPCCKQEAPSHTEHAGHDAPPPCHEPQPDDAVPSALGGCDCLCSLQQVTLPVPSAMAQVVRFVIPQEPVPLPPLAFITPIDNPPKPLS